jgi:hypothetical protein
MVSLTGRRKDLHITWSRTAPFYLIRSAGSSEYLPTWAVSPRCQEISRGFDKIWKYH